jgi:threonine dehydrogenase-like Zn-dependent dehydrogenase
MGIFADPINADCNIIGGGKELTVIGSRLSGLTYPAVIKGMRFGRIRAEGLVTHKLPLADWRRAFEVAQSKRTLSKSCRSLDLWRAACGAQRPTRTA